MVKRYTAFFLSILLLFTAMPTVLAETLESAQLLVERYVNEFGEYDSKNRTEQQDGIRKFLYTAEEITPKASYQLASPIADDEVEISFKVLPVMSGGKKAIFFLQFLQGYDVALELKLEANASTSKYRLIDGKNQIVLADRDDLYQLESVDDVFTAADFNEVKIVMNRPKKRLYAYVNGVETTEAGGVDISASQSLNAIKYASHNIDINKVNLYYYTSTGYEPNQFLYVDEVKINSREQVFYDPSALAMNFTAAAEFKKDSAVINITGGTDSMYLGQEMILNLVSASDETSVTEIASVAAAKAVDGSATFSFSETVNVTPGWYYAEVIRKIGGEVKGKVKRQRVYLTNIKQLLEADAKATAPSAVLNDNFVLQKTGPYGSEIVWTVSNSGLFDADGRILPDLGKDKSCTLTATLTYDGVSLEKTYETLCYRQPEYQINGFLYQKPDGTTIRHMQVGATVVGVDMEKNCREQENATVLVGIYENGMLKSIATGSVEQTGIVSLQGSAMITDTENTEMKCFLWDGFSNCKPLVIPKEQSLEEIEKNIFFNTNTATTDSGEDAGAAVDENSDTVFRFSVEPEENTHGNSLYLYHSQDGENNPMVRYETDPITGNVVLEQSFLTTESEFEKGLLYLYDQNNAILFSLIISGDILEDNKNHIAASNILPYRWYHVRTEMDFATRTADVYVNGAMGYENMPFRNETGTTISKIQIHNSADGESAIYVDDLAVTVNSEEYLSEDFNDCEADALPAGWTKHNQKSGIVGIREFTDTHLSIYPQSLVIDAGRYSNLSEVTVEIPEDLSMIYYLEASTDNLSYVRVASHLLTPVSGSITDALDLVEMRYLRLTVREAVDQSGNYCNGAVAEIRLNPSQKGEEHNVATDAHVSVSTARNTTLDGRGLIDGIVSRYARRGEWNAGNEANPKAFFSWDAPQTVDTVQIFGRLTDAPTVGKVELLFDDGTALTADAIPANGLPVTLRFPEKQVNWIQLRLVDITTNAGLSEFRVYSSKQETNPTEYILPWKTVQIPKSYGGQWTVSDDIDGDGTVEFVSARGLTEYGNHETSAACAFTLDGTVLWTWGTADSGSDNCGSDIACQIYDIDRDGIKEVLLSTRSQFIILNGMTGEQERIFDLPSCENHTEEWASDSIILADISGVGYPTDIIVKTRYTDVWAYTKDWELIWHHCMPNGMKTAHAPEVLDLDHDGHDEVLAGFCFVDEDGSIISAFDKTEFTAPIAKGHIDSFAYLKFAKDMPLSEMRFLISPCGANNIFVVDGTGKKLWESDTNLHYETVIAGRFTENATEPQFVTNPVHNYSDGEPVGGSGYNSIYFYDTLDATDCVLTAVQKGFTTNRYLYAVNMNGKYDYVYQLSDHVLFDAMTGNPRVRLLSAQRASYASMRWEAFDGYHNDIDGDGTQDIVSLYKLNGSWYLAIHKNPDGAVTATKLGTGYNYTYY